MKYSFKNAIVAVLLLVGTTQVLRAQDGNWFVGVQGGTSFGQATFRSITEHRFHPGLQGGVFGGYRFNRLFSLETALQYGAQSQYALDCCNYWMSEDGLRFQAPVLDETGWYYGDMVSHTQWGRLALQGNLNLLGFFTAPECRWALNLGPQISAVTTRTKNIAPDNESLHDRQWHMGLGGQASVGYRLTEKTEVSLYGGVASLTGERFDNIPESGHTSNLIWDAGFKLAFNFSKRRSKAPVEVSDGDAARLAAEREAAERERLAAEQAERERLAREQAEREKAEREAAERLAREKAEREAAEAAARKEEAFRTQIPTVYFAHNSHSIEESSAASLQDALSILEQYPDFNLEIHAYSSRSGQKQYNEQLSKLRMEEVMQWFASHGISMERMEKAFFHGVDYDAPSADKARRADIQFVK